MPPSFPRAAAYGLALLAACAAFVATLVWRFLTFTGFTNDHYAHLALAQQWLMGDRPVRDFTDPGWPLTYLLSAAAWSLAGDTMAVEWILASGALAVAAACTVVAAHRLSGSIAVALVVTALEIFIYPRSYAYPKLVAYAVAACAMLAVAARPSRARIVALGAAIAVAFLLRHDHGLYVGLASAACVALASRAERFGVAVRRVAMLTAAAGAFLLPWILFVTLNGGLPSYFETAVEFARAEANASNLRSWPTFSTVPGQPLVGLARPDRPLVQVRWTADTTLAVREALERQYGLEWVRQEDVEQVYYVRDFSVANLEALGKDPHVDGTSGFGRASRPAWRELLATLSPFRLAPALHSAANADAWLFWLFWTLPVVAAAAVLWKGAGRFTGSNHDDSSIPPAAFAVVLSLCVVAVLVNAGFLRDILRTRLPDAVVPAALLGAWLLGRCWAHRWTRRGWQRAAQLASLVGLVVTTAAVASVGETGERLERSGITDGVAATRDRAASVSQLLRSPHRQTEAPPSRYAEALMPFFSYLDRCSTSADRLIVTGEFPEVPVLAGRRFASDGAVFGAWYSSALRQDRTLMRLRVRPALFVLLMDEGPFRARFPLIADYVAEGYEPIGNVPVEGAGTIPILVHRDRRPSGTDATSGWPCFR